MNPSSSLFIFFPTRSHLNFPASSLNFDSHLKHPRPTPSHTITELCKFAPPTPSRISPSPPNLTSRELHFIRNITQFARTPHHSHRTAFPYSTSRSPPSLVTSPPSIRIALPSMRTEQPPPVPIRIALVLCEPNSSIAPTLPKFVTSHHFEPPSQPITHLHEPKRTSISANFTSYPHTTVLLPSLSNICDPHEPPFYAPALSSRTTFTNFREFVTHLS